MVEEFSFRPVELVIHILSLWQRREGKCYLNLYSFFYYLIFFKFNAGFVNEKRGEGISSFSVPIIIK